MTRYDYGFLTKCAQSGLSEADAKTILDYVKSQNAEKKEKDRQHEETKRRNRSDRKANGTLRGALFGGLAGGGLGGVAGRGHGRYGGAVGALAGAGLGAVGGGLLGRHLGNRKADKMERIEKDTGLSLNDQMTQERLRENYYMNYLQLMNQMRMQDRLNAMRSSARGTPGLGLNA